MGEIADSLINGDFDFYTGEYIGRGYGIPRTKNKSLPWEKRKGSRVGIVKDTKESAYNGIKKYITQKWSGRKYIPSVRSLIYEYTGESNFDIKQRCLEIQKDFGKFCQWINKRLKNETNNSNL